MVVMLASEAYKCKHACALSDLIPDAVALQALPSTPPSACGTALAGQTRGTGQGSWATSWTATCRMALTSPSPYRPRAGTSNGRRTWQIKCTACALWCPAMPLQMKPTPDA